MRDGTSGPRFGLFGGTFNPIHLGHLRAAEEVHEALGLDRVLFVPSRIPPHKGPHRAAPHESDGVDPIVSAEQRLEWVERAIADHAHFAVDRIEIDRNGPSYLVDTLTTFRDRLGGSGSSVFIVGEDAFAEMGEWRAPEEIFALTDIAVMTRPPGHLEKLEQRIPRVVKKIFEFDPDGRRARHRESGTTIELVSITALDISSSKIRRACRERRSIRFLVPESIRASIEACEEYGPRSEGRTTGGNESR